MSLTARNRPLALLALSVYLLGGWVATLSHNHHGHDDHDHVAECNDHESHPDGWLADDDADHEHRCPACEFLAQQMVSAPWSPGLEGEAPCVSQRVLTTPLVGYPQLLSTSARGPPVA